MSSEDSDNAYNSEEEEFEDEELNSEYKEIYDSKMFLKVQNKKKRDFNIQFPKSSFDRIIELYGNEKVVPISFILFANPFAATETIRCSSRNLNIRTSVQIDGILDFLQNYYIFPASYEGLGELEKIRRAPLLKAKYLKNISQKMAIGFSEMINYISLQMMEINIRETMRTVVGIRVYQMIFNMIKRKRKG